MKPTSRGDWWDKPMERIPPEYMEFQADLFPADATNEQIEEQFLDKHGYPHRFIAHSGGGHMAGPVVKQLP